MEIYNKNIHRICLRLRGSQPTSVEQEIIEDLFATYFKNIYILYVYLIKHFNVSISRYTIYSRKYNFVSRHDVNLI